MRANLYMAQRNYKLAKKDFEKAIELNPSNDTYRSQLKMLPDMGH